MAAELGGRIRLGAVVESVTVSAGGCSGRASRTGEDAHGRSGRLRATGRCARRRRVRRRRTRSGSPRSAPSGTRSSAKVVTVYDRSVWADVGANGLSEGEDVLALDLAAARRRPLCLVPPERLGAACSPSRTTDRAAARPRRARADVRRLRRAQSSDGARPALGHRPLHARLRDPLVARRRAARRSAARHARIRRSTSAAPTSGWPATWRVPSAPAARRQPRRSPPVGGVAARAPQGDGAARAPRPAAGTASPACPPRRRTAMPSFGSSPSAASPPTSADVQLVGRADEDGALDHPGQPVLARRCPAARRRPAPAGSSP